MAKSRHNSLVFKVLPLYYFVCCVSAIKIDITRQQEGDFFTNPYAQSCKDTRVDGSFCRIANSSCYSDRPRVGDKCCLCHCGILESTFDERNSRCALNKDFRKGCTLRINGKNDDEFLTEINLNVDGLEDIKIPQLSHDSNLHRCTETKVEHMTRYGYQEVFKFFSITTNTKTFSINWRGSPNQKAIHGKVYRINIQCATKKKRGNNKWSNINDCLMIKSSGTFEIDHPGLPSASLTSSSLLTSTLQAPSLQTSPLQTSSPTVTSSIAAVASSSPHHIQPTSTVSGLRRRLSSTSELLQSSDSSSFATSESTSCLTSEYNILTSERTKLYSTPTRLFSSADTENEHTIQKTSTPTIMEKSVKPNPDESRQTVASTVVSPEQTNRSTKKGKNKSMVVYLSATIGILVAIMLVAAVVWYVVSSKRRANEKAGRSSVNPGSTKNEHINEEHFAMSGMRNDEIIYEGIYELASDEPSIIRTVSGGIANARLDDISNVGLYTALDECRDKASNYQALILPLERADSTSAPDVCKLSVPTLNNQEEITSEPLYQSLEEPLTNLGILSDEQMSSHVYSILEENRQPKEKKITEDDYLVVLPNETVDKPCDPPVYADLSQQREENEYQGLVTRKM